MTSMWVQWCRRLLATGLVLLALALPAVPAVAQTFPYPTYPYGPYGGYSPYAYTGTTYPYGYGNQGFTTLPYGYLDPNYGPYVYGSYGYPYFGLGTSPYGYYDPNFGPYAYGGFGVTQAPTLGGVTSPYAPGGACAGGSGNQVGIFDGPPPYFSPISTTVRVGEAVTWTNCGPRLQHNAVAPGLLDTGILAPGGSATVTFTTPGQVQYRCTVNNHFGVITVLG